MTRIRGGGGSQTALVCPTVSLLDGGNKIVEKDEGEKNVVVEEALVVEDKAYPKGPMDKSLLTSYEDHVAR